MTIPTNYNQNKTQFNPNNYLNPLSKAGFVGLQGLVAGALNYSDIIPYSFRSGLIYGGISGITHIALKPLHQKIDANIPSSKFKIVNNIFMASMPWVISAGTMHQLYKKTHHRLFEINPAIIGIALLIEASKFLNKNE